MQSPHDKTNPYSYMTGDDDDDDANKETHSYTAFPRPIYTLPRTTKFDNVNNA